MPLKYNVYKHYRNLMFKNALKKIILCNTWL